MKTRKLFKGTICRVATRCRHPYSENPKSFFYTLEKPWIIEGLASPLFDNLIDLFKWAKEKGFEPIRNSPQITYLSPNIEFEIETP